MSMSATVRMRYITAFSVYEVDWDTEGLGGRVRRLVGIMDPTPRQGEDGTWKRAEVIVDLPNGQGLWIDWAGDGKATWTSAIAEREELIDAAEIEETK